MEISQGLRETVARLRTPRPSPVKRQHKFLCFWALLLSKEKSGFLYYWQLADMKSANRLTTEDVWYSSQDMWRLVQTTDPHGFDQGKYKLTKCLKSKQANKYISNKTSKQAQKKWTVFGLREESVGNPAGDCSFSTSIWWDRKFLLKISCT